MTICALGLLDLVDELKRSGELMLVQEPAGWFWAKNQPPGLGYGASSMVAAQARGLVDVTGEGANARARLKPADVIAPIVKALEEEYARDRADAKRAGAFVL